MTMTLIMVEMVPKGQEKIQVEQDVMTIIEGDNYTNCDWCFRYSS